MSQACHTQVFLLQSFLYVKKECLIVNIKAEEERQVFVVVLFIS